MKEKPKKTGYRTWAYRGWTIRKYGSLPSMITFRVTRTGTATGCDGNHRLKDCVEWIDEVMTWYRGL